jgi:hypothetical protein
LWLYLPPMKKAPLVLANLLRHFLLVLVAGLGLTVHSHGQELFKENIESYSKLYKRPWLTPVTIEYQMGGAYYTGDLTGSLSIGAQNYLLNPAFSLAVSYRLTDYISIRAQGSYFRLRATANQPAWDSAAFRSNNLEGTVMIVHDLYSKRTTEAFETRLNPYLGVGIGMLRFEPRDPVTKERLRPLREKYGYPTYGNTTLVIPICFGVQYTLFEDTWVGLEATYHFTTTDYLDNAAPFSGSAKDGYYLFGVRAGVQLYGFFNYRNYLHSK